MNDEIMESYRFQPPIETLSQSTTDAHGPEPFAWLRRLGNPQPSPQPDAIPTEIVSPCRDSGQDVPHPAASVVSLMPQPSPQPAYGCSEPTRCRERDKAECEWCMTPHTPDASLPQGDITADVSLRDDDSQPRCEDCGYYLTPWKCNGGTEEYPCPALSDAVASDAPVSHRGHTAVSGNTSSDSGSNHVSDYGHDEAMDAIASLWRASDYPKLVDALAAYIERLEVENDELQSEVDAAIENMGNYRADRDRWKAKAEWLAGQLDFESAHGSATTWLADAEEATR